MFKPSLLGSAALTVASILASGIGFVGSAQAAGGKGYTTGLYAHDSVLGIDHIGHNSIGDPYVGDTSCAAKRPVLCIKVDGSARPPYPIADSMTKAFYNGWVEGHFARTKPVKGTLLTSLAAANAQCTSAFGAGWRMAEFHDGRYLPGMDDTHFYGDAAHSPSPWPSGATMEGGHTMYGYGNLGSDTRFWTHINDQPGNCWNP
ncbi:MAG: flagellar hook-length control protein [Ideonella sp. MAG2]|nr:MAG: flagellar hook-length control protein [Ideonella sp. MAG2]